jgi:WD40 repeat protein
MNWQNTTNIIILILVTACVVLALLSGENKETITMQSPGTIGSDSLISFEITGKIDMKTLQDSFVIEPKTEFLLDVSSSRINLIPKTSLIPGKTYRIKFKGQILGTLGKEQELEQEFTVEVRKPKIAVLETHDDITKGLSIFTLDGKRETSFGDGLGNLLSFSFSPEADEVVCSFIKEPLPTTDNKNDNDSNRETDVHVINTATGDARKMDLPKAQYKNLVWSPKGRAIAAIQNIKGTNRIVFFDTEGNFNRLYEDENVILSNDTPLLFSKDSVLLVWFDDIKESFAVLNLANYRMTSFGHNVIPSRISLSPLGDFLFSDNPDKTELYGVFIGPSANQAGKPVVAIDGQTGAQPFAVSDGINAVWARENFIVAKNLTTLSTREHSLEETPFYPSISADSETILYLNLDGYVKLLDVKTGDVISLCPTTRDKFGTGFVFVP